MATNLKSAPQKPSMAAKEERARDAALAMREYEAERRAVLARTARLRALRLAKEATSEPPGSTLNKKKQAKEGR